MDRKEFIKSCSLACVGIGSFGLLLQGCTGSKIVSAHIQDENLIVPILDFEMVKNGEKVYRNYLIVQNEKLQYPIYIYRFSQQEYNALYMQCTHQGNELSAYGDKMVCSAHGSEFDNRGNVTNTPAEKPLKSFQVIIENQHLKISLKAT